ncbi:MAG: DJ-1 family protein [Proteobacteria bacterium]|nr:DJ-1 family protein [Pseudomonadota bacterium]
MKRMLFFLLVIPIFIFGNESKKNVNILMIVAPHNFRDEEFQKPYDYFISRGYNVIVASTTTDSIKGMLGLKIKPNKLIGHIVPDSFDILVMPGGNGAGVFFRDTTVSMILKSFKEKKKIIAAICLSPVTLAKNGILKGKRATAWPSIFTKHELKKHGATYIDKPVVIDGNVITANGPRSALKFAKAIDSVYTHKKEVKDVK